MKSWSIFLLAFAAPVSIVNGEVTAEAAESSFHLALADKALNDAALTETAPPAKDFAAGTWTFQMYGSGTLGFDNSAIYLGHIGVGYHIANRFSINIEGIAGYLDTSDGQGDDGATGGIELLLRWHVVQSGPWTLYVDGGAGLIWFADDFPNNGTQQNFTPQLGFGFTTRLTESLRLMAGVRWHHVSNANKSGGDRNPGWDGVMFYAGLMMPF